MAEEHWFDVLNKGLVRDAPRRTLLRAAAAVVASLALGAAPLTEAAKNRKKKNKGKKQGKKDKPNPNPAPSCSGGACAAVPQWAGNQQEIDFCELVCRQCDGDDLREFCIVEGLKPDGTPTKIADCCDDVQECCSGLCCGPSFDAPGVRCCDGECVNTTRNADHCGRCGNPCIAPPRETGYECCDGLCVHTLSNPDHCGGCNQRCPSGAACVDGRICRCPEDQVACRGACRYEGECIECDPPCIGAGEQCCDGQCCGGVGLPEGLFRCCRGRCVKWATDANNCHRDACGAKCPRATGPPERTRCCGGDCYDPSRATCCPNDVTLCPTPFSCVQSDVSGNGWACRQL